MRKNGDLYSECVTRFLTNQNRTKQLFSVGSAHLDTTRNRERGFYATRPVWPTGSREPWELTHLECWIGRPVEVWCGLVPFWNWAAPRAAALSRLRSKPRPESLELSQLLTLADDDEDEDVDDPTGRCCCCCCCCRLNC